MKITGIKVNGIAQPLGYDFSHVTVSFRVEGTESKKSAGSAVTIAKDPEFRDVVAEKAGELTCSCVTFDLSLAPRTRYYVGVSVTGDRGDCARGESFFETGKLGEAWLGRWIGQQPGDDFHPEFEKSFTLAKKPVSARLYITGLGLFEAEINGKKVGSDRLAPFFNDYNEAVQVCTYDVTDMLASENRISVKLGNGWYKGRLGYEGASAVYGDRFALIAELRAVHADGSEEVIATDDSWTYRPSEVTFSDIYDGETIDRTVSGKSVQARTLEMDRRLSDRMSPPLTEELELPVREIIHTPAGETVLDFGQNFSGFVRFHADFSWGTRIVLTHGEILQNGNFYNDNYRTAKVRVEYISGGVNEWVSPTFTYMGFRYVKVEGWPDEFKVEDFRGVVLHSEMERTGRLTTGHKGVNRLVENGLWGLRSNFVDMPTDCPQRDERLGWTGDAQVFAPTASFFMDTRAFYRKFLWDLRTDQVKHGGAVAAYLPNFGGAPEGAAAWADAAAFIPDTVYEAFADEGLLREQYPLMRDWVEWMARCDLERHGRQTYLFDCNFTFGDWLAMDGVTDQSMKGGTEDGYVGSVYFYASTVKTARAARTLGYTEDAEKYEKLAENIKAAILNEYFTPSGRLAISTQAGYITALKFGLYRDKAAMVRGLRARLKLDGYRIKCGFVGAPLLCETLAENGMGDIALHMFLSHDFPSWLHCVDLGATTIWERWNSVLDDGSISGTGMNSLNHYAYGSVINYAVRHLAGLRPAAPGYKKAVIEPTIDARLGHLECEYLSPYGKYAVSWKIGDNGELSVHVTVPFDCEATLKLPEREDERLFAGEHEIVYRPKRDYRCIYTWESLLGDVAADPSAVDAVGKVSPGLAAMAESGDVENLGLTLRELREMPWFGFGPEEMDKVADVLFKHEYKKED